MNDVPLRLYLYAKVADFPSRRAVGNHLHKNSYSLPSFVVLPDLAVIRMLVWAAAISGRYLYILMERKLPSLFTFFIILGPLQKYLKAASHRRRWRDFLFGCYFWIIIISESGSLSRLFRLVSQMLFWKVKWKQTALWEDRRNLDEKSWDPASLCIFLWRNSSELPVKKFVTTFCSIPLRIEAWRIYVLPLRAS